MICCICKNGQTHDGQKTVTLEIHNAVLVIRKVPAQICKNCGEAYVGSEVTRSLLELARNALHAGIELQIREFCHSEPAAFGQVRNVLFS